MQVVFPNPTTVKMSTTFVRKLIAVSISNITYLRGMLPELDYVDREYEGLHLKILTEKIGVASSAARDLINWVKGALDAFEKGYLRQLILYIYPKEENPNVALESYTFSFKNKPAGDVVVTASSGSQSVQQPEAEVDTANLRKSIVKLLRNNYMMSQRMKSLPPEVMMAMKLFYYDEVTPEDYQPPFFQQAPTADIEYVSKTLQLHNGKVSTPFHSVKLNTRAVKSCFTDECDIDSEEETAEKVPDNEPTTMEVEQGVSELDLMDCIPPSQPTNSGLLRAGVHTPHSLKTQQETIKSPSAADIPVNTSPAQPASAVVLTGSAFDDDHSSNTEMRNAVVHCPCGLSREAGLQLLCQVCYRWNHAKNVLRVFRRKSCLHEEDFSNNEDLNLRMLYRWARPCNRFLKMQDCPALFCCVECHDPNDPAKQCSDLTLVPLSVEERKEICLYRHIISICMDAWRLSADMIIEELRIPHAKAEELMQRLDEDSVFKAKKGSDTYRVVNKRQVNTAVKKKYFTGENIHTEIKLTKDQPSSTGCTPVKAKRSLNQMLKNGEEGEEDEATKQPPPKKQNVSVGIKQVRIRVDEDGDTAESKPQRGSRFSFRK